MNIDTLHAIQTIREAISNGPDDWFPPVCVPELYSCSDSDIDSIQFRSYVLDTTDATDLTDDEMDHCDMDVTVYIKDGCIVGFLTHED